MRNRKHTFDKLLQYPIDDSLISYSVWVACKYGALSIVDRLLQDPRCDPSVEHNMALENTCVQNNLTIVNRLFQDPQVDPLNDNYNKNNYYLLERICCRGCTGNTDIVERLIQDPKIKLHHLNNALKIANS